MPIVRAVPALRLPPRIGWLDYACPDDAAVAPGDVVWVPFRRRQVAALLLEETRTSDVPTAKLAVLPETLRPLSRLDAPTLQAFRETAGLFHAPLPWLLASTLPAVPRRAMPLPESIRPAALGDGTSGVLVRHRGDVAERYIAAIRETGAAGRQTLILVPDILRGTELWEAFSRARLCVAFCHHELAAGARWKAWNALARQESDALIVTKSGVFAPAPLLGQVIIDGEDDADHVQRDASPYLDAREVAERRARLSRAAMLLASETPRFATAWRAKDAGWESVSPPAQPPETLLVPLRQEPAALRRQLLSGALLDAAREAGQSGKNVVALLNRTASARSISCADCGLVLRCPTCGLAQAVRDGGLACVRCGTRAAVPGSCPRCGGQRLTERGPGIDAVRAALARALPELPVHALARDRDVPADAAPAVFLATETLFKNARGVLSRPLGLVAALEADTGLRLPEYRAAEQAWALLERLANVARRAQAPLLLQAWEPDHPVLAAVRSGTPAALVAQELTDRKAYGYPPFAALWTLYPTSTADAAAAAVRRALPDADVFPVDRAEGRRAVRGRPALRLRTAAAEPQVRRAFAALPPDWIVEPEPERFS